VQASARDWNGQDWDAGEWASVPFNHALLSSWSRWAPQNAFARETLTEIGRSLFEDTIRYSGPVQRLWLMFAERLRWNQEEARLVLKCEDEALANLPWECIFDAANIGFVALRVHFWRELRGLKSSRPGNRALIVASNPSHDLNLEEEVERCTPHWSNLFEETCILKDGTKGAITRELRERPCALFHFAGHSALMLHEDERATSWIEVGGRGVETSEAFHAGELAGLVASAGPQLAVLNSCWSGQHQAGSLLYEFDKTGVANIIAMNQPANDAAAIQFASTFYAALAGGASLERGLTHARRRVCEEYGHSMAWGLPTAAFSTPELCLR